MHIESGDGTRGEKFAIASGAANGNPLQRLQLRAVDNFEKVKQHVPRGSRSFYDQGNQAKLEVSPVPDLPVPEDGLYCTYIQPGSKPRLRPRGFEVVGQGYPVR